MGKMIVGFLVGAGLMISIWLTVTFGRNFVILVVLFGAMVIFGIVDICVEHWD
jgi:hypothetical protein